MGREGCRQAHAVFEQRNLLMIFEEMTILMVGGWLRIQWKRGGGRTAEMVLEPLMRLKIAGGGGGEHHQRIRRALIFI